MKGPLDTSRPTEQNPLITVCSMKRTTLFLSLLFSTLFTLPVWAQEAAHLKFKGIPMDGPVTPFVQKLAKQGLDVITQNQTGAILSGDFAGYSDCVIIVGSADDDTSVSNVSVLFEWKDTWRQLHTNYLNLKNMLTEKYGVPYNCTEEFSGGEPDSDWLKMLQVEQDECRYVSRFAVEGGEIILGLSHIDWGLGERCHVMLMYQDGQHAQANHEKALDDL